MEETIKMKSENGNCKLMPLPLNVTNIWSPELNQIIMNA